MDFFDKLGKKASEAYQTTKEKTTQLSGELKLKNKINSNEEKIYELYARIGEMVYDGFVTNVDVDKETVNPLCQEIKNRKEEIEKAKTEILTLKNKKACVKCGEELDLDSGFCPKCGEKQPLRSSSDFRVEDDTKTNEASEEKEAKETKKTKEKKEDK